MFLKCFHRRYRTPKVRPPRKVNSTRPITRQGRVAREPSRVGPDILRPINGPTCFAWFIATGRGSKVGSTPLRSVGPRVLRPLPGAVVGVRWRVRVGSFRGGRSAISAAPKWRAPWRSKLWALLRKPLSRAGRACCPPRAHEGAGAFAGFFGCPKWEK